VAFSFNLSETKMTRLWDFGWFDLTRFNIGGVADSDTAVEAILADFLADAVSQRSFCTPGPWGEAVGHHGPFLHEMMESDWYRQITAPQLAAGVQAALNDSSFDEPPALEQRVKVETWVASVSHGSTLLVLDAPSAPEIRVEFSFIWPFFHEFIAVTPDRSELWVGVVSCD